MMMSRMVAGRSLRIVSHLSSMQASTPIRTRQMSMDAKSFTPLLVDAGLLRSQALIGGKWSDAYDGKTMEVTNPATGDVITTVPCMGQNETNDAISAAHNAFSSWSKVTSAERSKYLRKWYDLLVSHKEELGKLITLEQGKPLQEAMGEVTYGASFVEFFAEEAKRIYGDIIPAPLSDRRLLVLKQDPSEDDLEFFLELEDVEKEVVGAGAGAAAEAGGAGAGAAGANAGSTTSVTAADPQLVPRM